MSLVWWMKDIAVTSIYSYFSQSSPKNSSSLSEIFFISNNPCFSWLHCSKLKLKCIDKMIKWILSIITCSAYMPGLLVMCFVSNIEEPQGTSSEILRVQGRLYYQLRWWIVFTSDPHLQDINTASESLSHRRNADLRLILCFQWGIALFTL